MVGLPVETRDVDPVCGTPVEHADAVAQGLSERIDGEQYVFCGIGCHVSFQQDPRRLLGLDDMALQDQVNA
jgi:YHS domain-containing protein